MSKRTHTIEQGRYTIYLTEHRGGMRSGPLGYTYVIHCDGERVYASRYYPCRLEHIEEIIRWRIAALEAERDTRFQYWKRACEGFEMGVPFDVRTL